MAALRKRFQGAMLGALIGDCLGSYWEMMPWTGTHSLDEVKAKISDQIKQASSGRAPLIGYTDDTAMTIVLAQSMIDCQGFDQFDLAKRFTEEFFANPERGYGASVSTVFCKLRNNKYIDVYGPAQQQFNGSGSYGNGGAMRITPAAILGYNNDELLIKVVTDSTKITHAHSSGINGALLQAMAIKLAMNTPQKPQLDRMKFIEVLQEKMKPFEEKLPTISEDCNNDIDDKKESQQQGEYFGRLEQIKSLLAQNASADIVQETLGHGVSAYEAVPCAIYSFLKCCNESFQELIPFAISLGGDTDTIACMAGAIGGAFWGIDDIPIEWINNCESNIIVKELANKLYDFSIQ